MLEFKNFKLEGKSEDGKTVFGYCSVKNTLDSVGDVILDSAYKNLDDTMKKGFTCVNHKHSDLPTGFITALKEDAKGLYFEAKFHSTEDGQEAYTVIRERLDAGLDIGLSIGYKTLKASFGEFEGQPCRFLEELEVREITFTLLPANEDAGVDGLKTRTQEFESIKESVQGYTQRLVEIKSLGRGEAFNTKAANELQELKTILSNLEQTLTQFTVTDAVITAEEQKSTEALGAEVEEKTRQLELAKVKALAALALGNQK